MNKYNKIFNPMTKRFVNIHGKKGMLILKNYLNQLVGSAHAAESDPLDFYLDKLYDYDFYEFHALRNLNTKPDFLKTLGEFVSEGIETDRVKYTLKCVLELAFHAIDDEDEPRSSFLLKEPVFDILEPLFIKHGPVKLEIVLETCERYTFIPVNNELSVEEIVLSDSEFFKTFNLIILLSKIYGRPIISFGDSIRDKQIKKVVESGILDAEPDVEPLPDAEELRRRSDILIRDYELRHGELLSDDELSGGGKGAVELNINDMENRVFSKNNENWFIKFYAPWCGHCKNMKEGWDKASMNNSIKKNIYFGSFNLDNDDNKKYLFDKKNKQDGLEIQGFPTLKLFTNGNYISDFNGERNEKSYIDFLKKELSHLMTKK